MDATLLELIKIGATAIVTTGGTYLVTRLSYNRTVRQQEKEQKRLAQYLAIRVVTALDRFVADCEDFVIDDGIEDQNGVLEPTTTDPKLLLPTDVDWKSVEPQFMYRAMSLPNDVDFALAGISATIMFSGPPNWDEVFEARQRNFSAIGLKAAQLNDDLKREYGIVTKLEWNPQDTFKRVRTRLEETERQRKESANFLMPTESQ